MWAAVLRLSAINTSGSGWVCKPSREWETGSVAFVADDFAAWLIGLLADAGRKKLTTVVLGTEQERMLRSAATAAVRLTAEELHSGNDEQTGHVALVISQVFSMPVLDTRLSGQATLLQALQAGVAGQLAVLDDANITEAGQSSADVLGVPGVVLAEKLTSHLLREIVIRGASGGSLFPLASQLNHDLSHLQGQRLEGVLGQLAGELREALSRIGDTHASPPRLEMQRPADSVDTRPGLSNLPMRTDLFVGRARELDRLDSALTTPGGAVVQAVHGLGGIGKSTLAAHWAATRGHHYYPIRWIVAETAADIQQGLAELASDLEPALFEFPTEAQARWGMQWLATHKNWLLILDNVDRAADVESLLARASGGRFLITSRSASGWRGISTLSLDVLDEAEAIDLFTQIITSEGPRDLEGAAELCSEVGYLPLAIEQAAAYLAQNPLTTPREYLDLLDQYPAEMYRQGAEQTDDDRTIARVWRITLDKIAAKQSLATDLLRALAWYSADAIPGTVPYAILDGTAEHSEINAALGLLVAYSMVTADPATRTYLVHRLVQAFLRTPDLDDPHRTPELISRALRIATHLHSALPEDGYNPSNWQDWDRLIPHINRLFDNVVPDSYDVAIVLHRVGTHLLDRGQPRRALMYLEHALAGVAQLRGEDDSVSLTYRHNLACAFVDSGDPGRAVSLFEQTLESRERRLGENHPDTKITRDCLACAYAEAGELDRAIPMLEEILERRVLELGENHLESLEARHNLACAYRDSGDLDRAIPLFECVVAATEDLGENVPRVLVYRHNLANAILSTGDLDRAIPMLERSLEDAVRLYGDNHHSTLLSRNSLANAYVDTGDRGRAIHLYEQALETALRVLGEDHPHTQIIRSNLVSTTS